MLVYLSMIESPEDKSKFEAIYHKYRDLMFYAANRILMDSCDAEDTVHEAFVKIIDLLDEIHDVDSPQMRSLVVIITKNKAIDLYRKKHNQKVIPFEEENVGGRYYSEVERAVEGKAIVQAIKKLPEKYSSVLLLKYSHGYSTEEIAEILSMSKENVKKTIQRARKKLEEIIWEEEMKL